MKRTIALMRPGIIQLPFSSEATSIKDVSSAGFSCTDAGTTNWFLTVGMLVMFMVVHGMSYTHCVCLAGTGLQIWKPVIPLIMIKINTVFCLVYWMSCYNTKEFCKARLLAAGDSHKSSSSSNIYIKMRKRVKILETSLLRTPPCNKKRRNCCWPLQESM